MVLHKYIARRAHYLLLPAACAGVAVACDLMRGSGESVGSSTAAVTVGTNAMIVGDNQHYASVAAVIEPTGGTKRWLVVYDNLSTNFPTAFQTHNDATGAVGWALSTDISGSSWTAYEPDAGWEESNCVPATAPSDGSPFKGWAGDPTVATIGNPPDGTTALIVSVASSTTSNSDIAYLLSTNGGVSWGTPTYLTQQPEAGGTVGAIDVDQPLVVSNVSSPYSTFAAWTSNIDNPASLKSWITSINNTTYEPSSSSSVPVNWSSGAPKQVPFANVVRPKIALSSAACGASIHEFVWVAWSDVLQGRVCGLGTPTTTADWYLTVFDNTTNTWFPSSEISIDSDTAWPNCIGAGTDNRWNSDEAQPAIIANSKVAVIAHNRSSALGSRIQVDQFQVTCNDAGVPSVSKVRTDVSPDACYGPGGAGWCPISDGGARGGNGADGGNVGNDQWGPALGILGGVFYLTWYDTSGDIANATVHINGTSSVIRTNPRDHLSRRRYPA